VRFRLVGYTGTRPPVPGVTPVDPNDPPPEPPPPDPSTIPDPLVLKYYTDDVFHPLEYLAMGYNHFDVMCIGAAGGRGGRVKQVVPTSATHWVFPPPYDLLYFNALRYLFPGGPGGGGVHRVQGRLILLPTECPVVVGQPGADAANLERTEAYQGAGFNWPSIAFPVGGDGGHSSFGDTVCRASGGDGGGKYGIAGGHGGIGNSLTPGGGGNQVTDGTWDGKIGGGGGGGEGGDIRLSYYQSGNPSGVSGVFAPRPGTRGAYSSSDTSVRGDAGAPNPYNGVDTDYTKIGTSGSENYLYTEHFSYAVKGPGYAGGDSGAGGGATAFPLDGELVQWGSWAGGINASVAAGLVVVRLTYKIT